MKSSVEIFHNVIKIRFVPDQEAVNPRDFEMDFSPIPTIKESEAKKIKTPLTIIGADDDLIFPGEKLLKRAKSIFPSLQKE